MKAKKQRFVRRVLKNRERQRDAAAGVVARANIQRQETLERLDQAVHELQNAVSGAAMRLHDADSVWQLVRNASEVSFAHAQVEYAGVQNQDAQRSLDQASALLRRRARELKSVEKLMDQLRERRATREQRNEQTLADELAARKVVGNNR